ncbi:MAG: LytTR family transcriptional regulator [Clostridia bacterium]|nr:LytTR family transcriptional regulator [Clostridia bacterium]
MKCEVIIHRDVEEKVVIYAKEDSRLVQEIRQLATGDEGPLIGYKDKEATVLDPAALVCVSVIGHKVYAVGETETWQLKERLYALEERLPSCFAKINQSCIANLKKIARFDASISGTLRLHFQNGHTDYVSRRQIKYIKERMGLL